MNFTGRTERTEKLNVIVARACSQSRHLLDVLYTLQQKLLHISDQTVRAVSEHLDLPVSQVESVVEFYSFLSKSPRGKYNILFSNCTSCGFRRGGENLLHLLCDHLHMVAGETRTDGLISIDETSCIGMCDHGAALLVNGMPITGLDSRKIMRVAELVEMETALSNWPAEWFRVEDNIRRGGCCSRMTLLQVRVFVRRWPVALMPHFLKSSSQGYADGVAQDSVLASNGNFAARPRELRITCFAMPMKGNLALSRIVCCCIVTLMRCSKE